MNNIFSFWEKGIARGKTTEQQKQEWSANLFPTSEISDAVKDADMVIEAVPEIMDLKCEIFQSLGSLTKNGCILGTNTSSYCQSVKLLRLPENLTW